MENIMEKPIMEKFKASSDLVQVKGEIILCFLKANPDINSPFLKKFLMNALSKNNIVDLKPDQWYSHQDFLNVFKDVYDFFGRVLLEEMGRNMPKFITLSGEKPTNHQLFSSVDDIYRSHHRGGEIGYYKLLSYDEKKRTLTMECNTPYPQEFTTGFLFGVWHRIPPPKAFRDLIISYECYYNILTYKLSW